MAKPSKISCPLSASIYKHDRLAALPSKTYRSPGRSPGAVYCPRIVWSGLVALVAYKFVDIVIGLRVPEDEEREGLDITAHGESAYRY